MYRCVIVAAKKTGVRMSCFCPAGGAPLAKKSLILVSQIQYSVSPEAAMTVLANARTSLVNIEPRPHAMRNALCNAANAL